MPGSSPFREQSRGFSEAEVPSRRRFTPRRRESVRFRGLVPAGLQHYWKANFVKELTDEAIEAHLEHRPKVPVVNSTMHIYPINGACHEIAPDATAFAYRDANFATVIAGTWPDPSENEASIKWVRDYYDATAPHSEEGGYINFMAEDDQSRIQANYRATTTDSSR